MDDSPDFAAAMINPKIGRPRKNPNPIPNNISIYDNTNQNIHTIGNIDSDIKDLSDKSVKDQLTRQELSFLDLLFNAPRTGWKGQKAIDRAMLAAGYGSYSQDWRYKLARKIIAKYERGAGGASQVFRDIGFGQLKVAQGIADKAENAESEAVSLSALTLAARCQGMTEPKESTGNQVIIQINTGPSPGPALPGAPPALVINADGSSSTAPAMPRKPLQITR